MSLVESHFVGRPSGPKDSSMTALLSSGIKIEKSLARSSDSVKTEIDTFEEKRETKMLTDFLLSASVWPMSFEKFDRFLIECSILNSSILLRKIATHLKNSDSGESELRALLLLLEYGMHDSIFNPATIKTSVMPSLSYLLESSCSQSVKVTAKRLSISLETIDALYK